VHAHQHSAGAHKKGDQSIGAAKVVSTKMHTTVDVLGKTPPGLPSSQAQLVICKVPRFCRFNSLQTVDCRQNLRCAWMGLLTSSNETAKALWFHPKATEKQNTPPTERSNKAQHLIENFFCKLKQYRAIATRYDKTATNFLAAIHFVSAVIWLNWGHTLNSS
jgi:hypothetical protein